MSENRRLETHVKVTLLKNLIPTSKSALTSIVWKMKHYKINSIRIRCSVRSAVLKTV